MLIAKYKGSNPTFLVYFLCTSLISNKVFFFKCSIATQKLELKLKLAIFQQLWLDALWPKVLRLGDQSKQERFTALA